MLYIFKTWHSVDYSICVLVTRVSMFCCSRPPLVLLAYTLMIMEEWANLDLLSGYAVHLPNMSIWTIVPHFAVAGHLLYHLLHDTANRREMDKPRFHTYCMHYLFQTWHYGHLCHEQAYFAAAGHLLFYLYGTYTVMLMAEWANLDFISGYALQLAYELFLLAFPKARQAQGYWGKFDPETKSALSQGTFSALGYFWSWGQLCPWGQLPPWGELQPWGQLQTWAQLWPCVLILPLGQLQSLRQFWPWNQHKIFFFNLNRCGIFGPLIMWGGRWSTLRETIDCWGLNFQPTSTISISYVRCDV